MYLYKYILFFFYIWIYLTFSCKNTNINDKRSFLLGNSPLKLALNEDLVIGKS